MAMLHPNKAWLSACPSTPFERGSVGLWRKISGEPMHNGCHHCNFFPPESHWPVDLRGGLKCKSSCRISCLVGGFSAASPPASQPCRRTAGVEGQGWGAAARVRVVVGTALFHDGVPPPFPPPVDAGLGILKLLGTWSHSARLLFGSYAVLASSAVEQEQESSSTLTPTKIRVRM